MAQDVYVIINSGLP